MDKNIFNRKDKDLQLRANDGRIPLEGDRPVSKKKIVVRGPIPTQDEITEIDRQGRKERNDYRKKCRKERSLPGLSKEDKRHMRDIENDEKSGKKTLALRLGFKNAMIYEMIILVLPPILVLMYMMINHLQEQGKYYAFIFFVTVFPLMSLRRKIMAVKEPKELDPFLKQVAMITFVMSILVAIGLNYFA